MNRFWGGPALRRILLETVVLGVLAIAVGLSLNFKIVFNAFSGKAIATAAVATGNDNPSAGRLQEPTALPVPVALDELDDFLADGAVLVDARNSSAFAAAHLPGAVSLPLGDFPQLRAGFAAEIPLTTPLITYCSGFGCPDSFDLGVLLLAAGYQDVLVYEGGLPEWRDAGRPLEGAGQ